MTRWGVPVKRLPRSCLDGRDLPLVLDASVIINLLATGITDELAGFLGVPVIAEANALREVHRNPLDGSPASNMLEPLIQQDALRHESMNAQATTIFLSLTGATPPDDLNDGEAATLAHALEIGGSAAIDEKKATRISGGRFPKLVLCSTMDIFCNPSVVEGLGSERLSGAVYNALKLARMRVPIEFDEWVRDLLGPDRIVECNSLKRR